MAIFTFSFFFICSISRKPIRSKGGRQSSMSIHSVTTVSSEEGINTAISVVSVSGQAGVSVEPDMQRMKVPGIEAKQPVPSKVQTLLRATPDFQSPTFRRHSNVWGKKPSNHRLRTPNEGINQRFLKNWAVRCGRQNMFWPCSEGYFLSGRP